MKFDLEKGLGKTKVYKYKAPLDEAEAGERFVMIEDRDTRGVFIELNTSKAFAGGIVPQDVIEKSDLIEVEGE